jgi:NADP-dependent 3-hydroxy acid dehydrogenase YdfG
MSDVKLLENKVAIITGGGRGVGRATALALAEAGADVVVVARSRRAIEVVAQEVRARGGQALAIPTDVSDPASVDLLVLQTLRASGRVDILINNASVVAPIGMAWEVPPYIWQRNINVNLGGVFLCAHAVLPHMIHQDPLGDVRGKIINVSSGAASEIVLGGSAYSAAKPTPRPRPVWTSLPESWLPRLNHTASRSTAPIPVSWIRAHQLESALPPPNTPQNRAALKVFTRWGASAHPRK